MRRSRLIAVLVWLAPGPPARAAAPPACDRPVAERAPDPRCRERLDGRTPEAPERPVSGELLAVPRLVSQALFWPVVRTADVVESHQVLDWMTDLLTTDDGLVGLRPEIQYLSGFIPTGGLRFFYRRLPGSGSEASARFITGGPSAVMGELGLRGPSWLGLAWRARWERRRDRLFAGIGPVGEDQLKAEGRGLARYASDAFLTGLGWSRRLPRDLFADLEASFHHRGYSNERVRGGSSVADLYGLPPAACAQLGLPEGCVDPVLVPGFARGLRIVHLGGHLGLDLLSAARDGGGLQVKAGTKYGRGVSGDPSHHISFDAETVLALGGLDRSFFLRVQAALVERLGDAPVPFEELISPSGAAGIRGYQEGRLRDQSGIVGSTEYRWYIARNLDASLFVDLGTVAGARFSGLADATLFPSFGVGLRLYHPPPPSYWRAVVQSGVQLAYAPGSGFRLLLTLAAF